MDWITLISGLIDPGLLITIPILYVLGWLIKSKIPFLRRYIPVIIIVLGIAVSLFYYIPQIVIETFYDVMVISFRVVTQGLTCAGIAILINEVLAQYKKMHAERNLKDIDAIREALLKDITITNIASGIGTHSRAPTDLMQSAQTVKKKEEESKAYWQ